MPWDGTGDDEPPDYREAWLLAASCMVAASWALLQGEQHPEG